MNGFIILHRKMVNWQWYTDTPTFVVFLHLLLKANWKETKWKTEVLQRGQLVTGIHALSEQTNLTVKQIRRALSNLEGSGEIHRKRASKYSVITITNYCKYQDDKERAGQAEGKQRASKGQQLNNDNNDNKKDKKIYGKRFTPPSIEEVRDYFLEKGVNSGEPDQFYDHHLQRNWILSNRLQMKDWKAAARTWIRNIDKFKPRGSGHGQKTEAAKQSELRQKLASAIIEGKFRPPVDDTGNLSEMVNLVQGPKDK